MRVTAPSEKCLVQTEFRRARDTSNLNEPDIVSAILSRNINMIIYVAIYRRQWKIIFWTLFVSDQTSIRVAFYSAFSVTK